MSIQESKCQPCAEAVLPITGDDLLPLAAQISTKWRLIDEHHLEIDFTFDDFKGALDFANQIGELAEELNHHPDLGVSWGKLRVALWTHKVNGLTNADFELAKRIDQIAK